MPESTVIVTGDIMRRLSIVLMLVLLALSLPALAKTKIKVVKNPLYESISLGPGEVKNLGKQYQDKLDQNGPDASSAFLFSNMMGYANGQLHITTFEAGLNFGGAFANLGYFDGAKESGSFPLASPVINIHAGIPLTKKSDLTLKLSIFDMVVTGQKPELMDVKIESLGEFMIGAKYRHLFFDRAPVIPFIFEFEGLSLGASADILNGSAVLLNEYELDIDGVGIDPGNGEIALVDTKMKGSLTAQTRWLQFSSAYDCLAYFTSLRFISFYGGFGCLLGYSWLGVDATTDGYLYAVDDSLDADIGNGFNNKKDYLLKLDYDAYTVFTPFPLIPYFTTGIEFDISGVKLLLETSVNFKNRQDVTALAGIRYQM